MWELLNQLIWLPFDIMQRISTRVLLLGRALYGGVFGPSRPAIKGASPPPPLYDKCQIRAISQSPAKELPVYVVNMEQIENSSGECQTTTASLNNASTSLPSGGVTFSELSAVTNPGETCSVTMCGIPEPGYDDSSYTANDIELPEVVVEKRDARGGNAESSENITIDTPADRIIRNRLSEKRRKLMSKFDEGPDMSGNLLVKKAKLSEDAEQPSTSLVQVKKPKKKRSKKGKKVESEQSDNMGQIRSPPNYFIAIQVADKDIVSNVAKLQNAMATKTLSPIWHGLETTGIFRDAMVPVTKLHFTLHVMHLKEGQLEKAQNALQECCKMVHDEFLENPMELTIEGLGHFRNNVIFAQIKEKGVIERLTQLSELFRAKFNELNIPVDPRPFNPHMTIAKISRSNKLYKRKIRSFPPDMMANCEQTNFGRQRVTSVQLLQMAGEDKATGYYHCLDQYHFEGPLKSTANLSDSPEEASVVTK